MRAYKYILNGKIPVPEHDLWKWAKWFETSKRQVAKTLLGDKIVSTVFLGLDHSFSDNGNPILFETMVFPECNICERYSTWEEAEQGHKKIVKEVGDKIIEEVLKEGTK